MVGGQLMEPPPYPPNLPVTGPPPRRRRYLTVVLGAALVAAAVGAGIVIGSSGSDSAQDGPVLTVAPASRTADEPDEPEYDSVDSGSFTIELRTTERHCFGSAGCNVTVEPEVTYVGDSADLDPEAVYEITYEIHGDEDGAVLETMELTDQTELSYTPSVVSTESSGTKVTVEITDVLTR